MPLGKALAGRVAAGPPGDGFAMKKTCPNSRPMAHRFDGYGVPWRAISDPSCFPSKKVPDTFSAPLFRATFSAPKVEPKGREDGEGEGGEPVRNDYSGYGSPAAKRFGPQEKAEWL